VRQAASCRALRLPRMGHRALPRRRQRKNWGRQRPLQHCWAMPTTTTTKHWGRRRLRQQRWATTMRKLHHCGRPRRLQQCWALQLVLLLVVVVVLLLLRLLLLQRPQRLLLMPLLVLQVMHLQSSEMTSQRPDCHTLRPLPPRGGAPPPSRTGSMRWAHAPLWMM